MPGSSAAITNQLKLEQNKDLLFILSARLYGWIRKQCGWFSGYLSGCFWGALDLSVWS